MTTDDRDDRIDELLREALQEEADTVVPSGDGLSRIQNRVRSGRSRQRWMRPALVIGSVTLLAAAGVGVYAATNGSGDNDKLDVSESVSPTPDQTDSPSPSPTDVNGSDRAFPKLAIFPFTTPAQERIWEASYADGHEPWKADPTAVAQAWVQNYLGEQAIDEVVEKQVNADGDAALITLGRTMQVEQQAQIPVTTVRLVKYGEGWVVVGAVDPQRLLSLTSPDPGATVSSPVTVTGPGYGVDEAATIEVFDSSTPGELGSANVGFGAGTEEWSASFHFDGTSTPVGAVVAVQDSAADGKPQRLVAQQVLFGAETVGSPAPPYFYSVKSNRIAKFSSQEGAFVEYLTEEQPGGGPTDPQVGGTTGRIYYLEGSGTCSNALVSVRPDGSQDQRNWASPDAGYVISGYSVLEPEGAESDPNSPEIAYYEQACSDQSPQAKLVMRTWDGSTHTVNFKAEPPALQGDPSWSADGESVVAFVRTGNDGYLARYDAHSGKSATPDAVCSDGAPDGMPTALEIDATADMWVALQTGSSMTVATCGGGAWHEQFSVPGNDQPADVDVTADGTAVLLTDVDGNVWKWDGGGEPTHLTHSLETTHATW